jgi:hypothetical protein
MSKFRHDLPIIPEGPDHKKKVALYANTRRWNGGMDALLVCPEEEEPYFLSMLEELNVEYRRLKNG